MGVVIEEVTGSVEPEARSEARGEHGSEGQGSRSQKAPDVRGELQRLEMREARLRAD